MNYLFYSLSIGLQAATLALIRGTFEELSKLVPGATPPFIFYSLRISTVLIFLGPLLFWVIAPFVQWRMGGRDGERT